MFRAVAWSLASVSLFVGVAQAEVVPTSYTFTLSLQPAGTLRLRPHPHVVTFVGVSSVALQTVSDPVGTVTNPLYEDQGHTGTNPLFDGANSLSPFDPFEVRDFGTLGASFTSLGYLHRNNIIHRDLAARNILLTTSRGTFSSVAGEQFTFGSDGPADIRTPGDPPIRWTPPEVLRLYLNGDVSTGAYFEVAATLDLLVVPSPGVSAMLLAAGALAAGRRRR